ncbi:two-component response regulator ARR2-like isoform X2 [Diospyros lotus]|nr:two-component response regulator ARR2-like isoform X2 [Diospyros lotus]XP_052207827.1 two-component response regulator ARR2-like isoform X2 [Diospyros lotus]
MLMSSSGVSDQFPVGLRVLLVDDDQAWLKRLEKMLQNCLYNVTKCDRAEVALLLLRENKNGFDIVITDVNMPGMDGLELLEHIGLEMDLPVIMISGDDSKNVVMRGVTYGACDYLVKPISIEALKTIWQHVVRKKHELKDFEQLRGIEVGERQKRPSEDVDASSANEESLQDSKRKAEEDEEGERDDKSTLKKPRVVWSTELHNQFIAAVDQLGTDKAVPKKILQLMNAPGLTRENVASHLQKYRLHRRKEAARQIELRNSFTGPLEVIGSISSLNGLDLRALAATGELQSKSLATLLAGPQCKTVNKDGTSTPIANEKNPLTFETPESRFGGFQHPQLNINYKQISLLHGIPTTTNSKQLANLHQSAKYFEQINVQANPHGIPGSSVLSQNSQQRSTLQIVHDTDGNHLLRIPSSIPRPTLSSEMTSGGLARNEVVENPRRAFYSSVSQASSVVNFSINRNAHFPGNSFPLGNNSEMPSFTSKQVFREEGNSEVQAPTGFPPHYDISSGLHHQHKSQDWESPNVGFTFDASQQENMHGYLDIPSSVLFYQEFSPCQNSILNTNTSSGKVIFSAKETGTGNAPNTSQQLSPLLTDNSRRATAVELPDASYQNMVSPEQFIQDDLISALLKQPQESIGLVAYDFGFEGLPLDNLLE